MKPSLVGLLQAAHAWARAVGTPNRVFNAKGGRWRSAPLVQQESSLRPFCRRSQPVGTSSICAPPARWLLPGAPACRCNICWNCRECLSASSTIGCDGSGCQFTTAGVCKLTGRFVPPAEKPRQLGRDGSPAARLRLRDETLSTPIRPHTECRVPCAATYTRASSWNGARVAIPAHHATLHPSMS